MHCLRHIITLRATRSPERATIGALGPLLACAVLAACSGGESVEGTPSAAPAQLAGLFEHFESLGAVGASPAPSLAEIERGKELFLELGCGACHTVRGTPARGVVGPDLTHVGSRASIGAGALENTAAGLMLWITQTDRVKPGVHMPSYDMPPPGEVHALAVYLKSLQ